MKMRLFTMVYGEPYLSWFEQALVRSLCWPKNHAALQRYAVEHNIYGRENERDRLRAIAERTGVPLQFHPFQMQNSSGETLQPALFDHLRNCHQDGSALFMAPPDTIFGDGSVDAICQIGSIPGICVAVPHVRINAGCLPSLAGREWSNQLLVDKAFENLHATWTGAEATLANTNSFLGGVSWRRLRQGLYAVTHRLPTCYLANVLASDVDWFSRQYETGAYDHTWPAVFVKEQRQRTIGSSDAAFICELTRENENIPLLAPTNPDEPDRFWRDLEHNFVARSQVTVFRGASAE